MARGAWQDGPSGTRGGRRDGRDDDEGGDAQDEREDQPHPRQGDPGRPVRGELHGQGHPRPHLRAPLDHARASTPTTRSPGSSAPPSISSETGKTVFEQKDVEVPDVLEPARDQRRRQQVLPRPHRHARSARRSVKQLIDRVVNTIAALGARPSATSRPTRTSRLPGRADAPPRPPEDGVQLAGLVQRRDRGEAAVLGVLHQLGPGQHGLDHGPRQDRGHAVQVRLGRRRQPVARSAARKERMSGGGIASRARSAS